MPTIDPALASLVLDAVDGDNFEIFGQTILVHTFGLEFEPTGGMHDGGQDGFFRSLKGKTNSYAQISIRPDIKRKICQTIERVRDSGRTIESLTYLTSQAQPKKDMVESELERETGVSVRILDRRWIITQLQRDQRAAEIFQDRFSKTVADALRMSEHVMEVYSPSERMSVLSFLEVHADSEPSEKDLLLIAADSAIYYSLEGTDPEKKIFKTAEEIKHAVHEIFPSIRNRRDIDIEKRLERLSSKASNLRVRHHKKEGGYCLPFDVRSEFSDRMKKVKSSEVAFTESLRTRLLNLGISLDEEVVACLEACKHAIEETFEKQGLNFIASTRGATKFDDVKTYEFVEKKLTESVSSNRLPELVFACQNAIRGAFYSPTDEEKDHIFRLFKAFSIDFAIRGDTSVATYFANLVKDLKLYVGTDVIVRALSETCSRLGGKATQNALKILSRAGAKLYLTETVLDEVFHHIHATDKEFENYYEPWEKEATLIDVQNSDRILIRAYFYAKLEPEFHDINPNSWSDFLGLFGKAIWFRELRERDAFAAFLQRKFNLKLVSKEKIESYADRGVVRKVKEKLDPAKSDEILAWNDANLAVFIDAMRRRNGEVLGDSIYGFKTWWLTEESKVLAVLEDLRMPANITMHPQFLMNLFASSPGLFRMSSELERIFPTNFGLKISSRVDAETMHRFCEDATSIVDKDEANASAQIRSKANEMLSRAFNRIA